VTEHDPSLRRHVAALVLAVVVVWPALDLDGVFIADEGSYGAQVLALRDGSWDMGYAFREADGAGRFVPYHAASVTQTEVLPYASHPAWPTLLAGVVSVAGLELGLRVIGVASLVALAVLAWSIGREMGGSRAGPWAFWLAAASPALANAWMLWAHAPSAALGALLVLAALRIPRSWGWLAVAVGAAAGGVLLRSEGLLWAGAVAVALLLTARSTRPRLLGLAVGAAALGAWAVERSWISALTGDTSVTDPHTRGGSGVSDRLLGIRIAFLDGSVASDAGQLLGLLVVVATGAGVLLLRRRGARDPIVAVALGLAAVAFATRLVLESRDPAPGLVAAAPALLLALAWRPRVRSDWWVGLTLLLFGGAVAATIYPDGGAFQWGGRFLSPALGPLAAVAGVAVASGLMRSTSTASIDRSRQLLALAVGGVLAVQAAGAVVVPDRLRQLSEDAVGTVADLGPDVVVTGGGQVARLDWRQWPDRCWIAVPEDGGVDDARAVLGVLAESGVERVAYAAIDPDLLRAAGGRVEEDPTNRTVGLLTIPDPADRLGVSEPYRCSA
jgi:hypothetical protein